MKAIVLALLLSGLACTTAGAAEPDGPPLSAAPAPLPAAPPLPLKPETPRSVASDAATYDHCLDLTRTDPAAAEKLAKSWYARGGAHPAEHCAAVALIGLKHYKEGADKLEKLATAMVHAPASLRADVLDQGAQAWMLAGDAAKAYAVEGQALAFRPDDPDLLVDRAVAAGTAGWYDKAITDLDRVLTAHPDRVDALVYRAAAHRKLKQLDAALADADKAVALAPHSVAALLERGNIRRLKGDINGARHDWVQVGMLAPGSTEDAAAKDNIEHLEIKDAPAPAAK